MVFLTFITCCFSFIFFYKTLSVNPLPLWVHGMRLLSFWFWKDFTFLALSRLLRKMGMPFSLSSRVVLAKKKNNVDIVGGDSDITLLDLPDLVLESILEKLPPEGLCTMSQVCTSLRDRCQSDHLWEKHMKKKWGRVVGPVSHRKWLVCIASRKDSILSIQGKENSFMGLLTHLWPLLWIRSNFCSTSRKKTFSHADYSLKSWYLALESGKFWFPAQVYNRENGHVGFLLSCYDAELRYDPGTDTFHARYLPHGWKVSNVETEVTWDRVRASPVDTCPYDLHISDCLEELQPGDHIEIQWRRSKEFPYGWWYGVVGHLECCQGSASINCRCGDSETVILEFNHYSSGSRWRRMSMNRREHKEEGDETSGFYGGIRKLRSNEEIDAWKRFWPSQLLS